MIKLTVFPQGKMVTREKGKHRLLDICEEEGIDLRFSCKRGRCGSCKIKILDGLDQLRPKNAEEEKLTPHPDDRLACQCIVQNDLILTQEPPTKDNASS